jgi:Flp pilus assembly pilin Flp
MRIALERLCGRLLVEDHGGEVLEYALIAGLIVVAAISAIALVGTKVLGQWNSLSGSAF